MRPFALSCVLLWSACAKPSTPPPEPPPQTPAQPADGGDVAPDGGTERPGISAADCEGQGGKVVGDIGDGAIHRPEYRCEGGDPPIGTITTPAGDPQPIEGAVCCK